MYKYLFLLILFTGCSSSSTPIKRLPSLVKIIQVNEGDSGYHSHNVLGANHTVVEELGSHERYLITGHWGKPGDVIKFPKLGRGHILGE